MALVLSVVAGGTAYAFLHSLQQQAYHGAVLTNVYVAESTIPRGAPGAVAVNDGLVKLTQIPAKFRPAGTVTDLATIREEVATSDIPAGQVLVAGLFASPTVLGGGAAREIPKGDVAITVSVDAVHEVAGLVSPGDDVDVLFQTSTGQETFLYQNVPVLAVGTSVANPAAGSGVSTAAATSPPPASGSASSAPPSNLVTFAVPPAAAARIAFVQSGGNAVNGGLYLALVPPGNAPDPAPPSINAADLIPTSRIPG